MKLIHGSCHCGAVRFAVSRSPDFLTNCNCSICRRIGALWAHYPLDTVNIEAPDDATIAYVQGDATLTTHSCKTCGCTTHWLPIEPAEHNRMAVNFRMCDPAEIATLRVRQFDGADTWRFLD